MRRVRGACAALVVSSSVLLAIVPSSDARAADSSTTRLHVAGTAVRDGLGRQVLLRGLEVIDEAPPYLPTIGPAAFARMRAWGMDSVRLGILWRALMPAPGRVDTAYLDAIAHLVDEASAAGIYVVLEMHQDLWGSAYGGDGAPAWTDPRGPACPYVNWAAASGTWEANYFSPAVNCAFYRFWTDPQLQASYARAWEAVAARVAGRPMVAGFDLMNEPYSGPIPPGLFETRYLFPSEARWLSAIRRADPSAIGFVEPTISENLGVPVVPAMGLPPGVVYAPHLYGLWDFADPTAPARDAMADEGFGYATTAARLMHVPLWLGEFSVDYGDRSDDSFVSHEYALADGALAGASFWSLGSLLDAAAGGEKLLSEVVRPSPAAVAGTLTSFSFAPASGRFLARWYDDGSATSDFSVPDGVYPNGFTVAGPARWSYDPAGGVLHVAPGRGPRVLVVGSSRSGTSPRADTRQITTSSPHPRR